MTAINKKQRVFLHSDTEKPTILGWPALEELATKCDDIHVADVVIWASPANLPQLTSPQRLLIVPESLRGMTITAWAYIRIWRHCFGRDTRVSDLELELFDHLASLLMQWNNRRPASNREQPAWDLCEQAYWDIYGAIDKLLDSSGPDPERI